MIVLVNYRSVSEINLKVLSQLSYTIPSKSVWFSSVASLLPETGAVGFEFELLLDTDVSADVNRVIIISSIKIWIRFNAEFVVSLEEDEFDDSSIF